jgi:hypothetical protein
MKLDDKDVGLLVGGVVALAALRKLSEKVAGVDATNVFSATAGAVGDGATEAASKVLDAAVTTAQYGLGVAVAGGMMAAGYKCVQLSKNNFVAIRVSPSVEKDTKPQQIEKLASAFAYANRGRLAKLIKGRVWFQYLIMKDRRGKISFVWVVPRDKVGYVTQFLKEHYPNASVGIERDFRGIPFLSDKGKAGHMMLRYKKRPFGLREKLENNIGAILNIMPPESVIDIRFSPPGSQNDPVTAAIKKLFNRPVDILPHEVYDVTINLWSKNAVSNIARQIQQHLKGMENSLVFKSYWLFNDVRNGVNHWFVPSWRRFKMRDTELGQLLFHPPVDHPVMEHIEAIFEKIKPRNHELRKGLRIGFADHDDLLPRRDEKGNRPIELIIEKGRPIKLDWETLDRHGIVPGATGAGKGGFIGSFADGLLESWVDGKAPAGFTLLDPHESAAILVINRLLELEKQGKEVPWEKVHCYSFDPANPYPTPLNLLHYSDRYKASNSQKASEITEIILSSFPGDLSKSKVLIVSAIEALLNAGGHTIADIPKVFRDLAFLNRMISQMNDNEFVRDEILVPIRDELAKPDGKEAKIDALLTRLFPFIGHTDMRKSFCHPRNVIDGNRIIEDGEIVLVSFKNAPVEIFKLGGGWMANHYYTVAKTRKPYSGKHHYFMVDEAQLFECLVFSEMMKELRKFRVGLNLITQDMELLETEIKNVMKQNLGYLLTLRQNKMGSIRQTIEVMNGICTEKQIKNLEDNHGILHSLDGAANVLFPPPAMIWEGKRQPKDSRGAKKAYEEAEMKFHELIKRDCAPVEEATPEPIKITPQEEPAKEEVAVAKEERQPVAVGAEVESFGDLD